MKAAIAQIEVTGDLETNLSKALVQIEQAAALGADLILFGELWNTPFIHENIRAHAHDSKVILPAFSRAARENGIWILAGTIPLFHEDKNRSGGEKSLYNTCLVFNDQGEIVAQADKLHLLEVHTRKNDYRESEVFTPGDALVRFASPWGNIAIAICFDVRFPEVCRLLCEDCFLLAVCAGFNVHAGKKHWAPLIQTRAMENEVFVLAANPAHADYGSYQSYGHSMAVSPDGQILAALNSEEGLLLVDIDPDQVQKIRHRSPFWSLRRLDLYDLQAKGNVLQTIGFKSEKMPADH